MTESMKYIFHNNKSNSTVVIVEPWAEEFAVDPGSVLHLEISYAKIGILETAISQEYFTLWLWAGCRVEVFLDGKNKTPPSLSIPAFG